MDEKYQSFRVAPDGPHIRIEASTDEGTGMDIVFWDDIEFQFPGIHCVMHGDIAVSFARDSKRQRIEPRCIKYHPGIVLDVVLSNNTSLGPILRNSSDNSVNSLYIHSPHGSENHSPFDRDQELAQSLTSLSVNTSYIPGDDAGQQFLVETPDGIPKTPSGISRSPSTFRASGNSAGGRSSTPATPTTSQLIPQIQSTLQTSAQLFGHFEQSIKSGQLHQAESIKQEIRTSFLNLHTEMARNQELQLQMLEMQQTSAEMQQKMLQMQKQALDRLAVIQNRVQAVLTQTYELHEYPIPRLFIVLPRETQRRDMVLNPFTSRFRLYFLCECGDHARQLQQPVQHHQQQSTPLQNYQASWGSGSTTSVESGSSYSTSASGPRMATHNIHLAKHDGYDLDRPNEFFQKYGAHILTLLQMLKYGVIVAGIVVPPLAHLKLIDGIDNVQNKLEFVESSIEPKVDYAIQYLETLTCNFNNTKEQVDSIDRNTADATDPNRGRAWDRPQNAVHELEALEGADLRHLSTFLKINDESKVLGNLYRTVTNEGHVKWVCLDHYRENYHEAAVNQFRDIVAVNFGRFEEAAGKVHVSLSSAMIAKQFYAALERAKFIQELSLALDWETALDDLRTLRDTIRKTNVVILKLDFCSTQGPARDLFNRNRRFDPVLQMMANTKLQALYLVRCDGFWSRLTKTVASATASMSSAIQLRVLSVQGAIENWKVEQQRVEDLLRNCPRLVDLKLRCSDIDAAFTMVKNATSGFRHLQNLELSVTQADQQELVEIMVAQPQAEIASVVITTNKKPYTQLVFSGHVRKLVLCREFDLATEGDALKRIILENKLLFEVGILCSVNEFLPVYDLIATSCEYNKCLKHIEVMDSTAQNKIWTSDPQDPQGTHLELLGPDSSGREEILRAFGWALKKIPGGLCFTSGLLQGLHNAIRAKGSCLQRLHADITTLDEESLDLLTRVTQLSEMTLTKVNVIVDADQSQYRELATTSLSRFIIRMSPHITRLQLHTFGLSQFLASLSSVASEQSAASSLARTFTISGRGNTGAVTFPLAKPALANVIAMPLLQELDIQPLNDSHGTMLHCQINPPHIQWLQIPLASPSLRIIKLGFFDLLKDDWTALLQSLRFDTLEMLTLQGTNISDNQARQLFEHLSNAAQHPTESIGGGIRAVSLKKLRIYGSLITSHVRDGIAQQLRIIIPDCEVQIS
ncbi:hypothetical protein EDD21DRAFT_374177 [Dissophora ornata]|nr:hypothetical protein EDD21DRAFT_374177 [Dissophora ornata]